MKEFSLPLFCRNIVRAFFFLGPLGNLGISVLFSTPFRLFYGSLVFFPFLCRTLTLKELHSIRLFLPLLIYILFSGWVAQTDPQYKEVFPLFRSSLFLFAFCFACAAAFSLRNQTTEQLIADFFPLYLKGFVLSSLLCFIGYLGFMFDLFSVAFLDRLSIETQFAYHALRFSPGTYPNEYGIIASFILSSLLLIVKKKESFVSPFFSWILFFSSLSILTLMTTRAAYLSLFLSTILLSFSLKTFSPLLLSLFAGALSFFFRSFVFLSLQKEEIISGSSGERIEIWRKGIEEFFSSSFLGTGWGTQGDIHNVYLQIAMELGLVGMLFLFALGGVFYLTSLWNRSISRPFKKNLSFPSLLVAIGAIHVFSFSLTNHNLNHHLTWMVALLWIHLSHGSPSSRHFFYKKKPEL